ncbi:hypothetical protein TNCV_2619771 [Trichonephila clavipes]|uniref:Uncharacterized protein n=1 Tax=Trichonephila clavipes TaxID=2585209 RepID=A0A8X7BLK7_TRICX|nr:hypothetical protein TNCV_2619771 [Trichonephila clavipes]
MLHPLYKAFLQNRKHFSKRQDTILTLTKPIKIIILGIPNSKVSNDPSIEQKGSADFPSRREFISGESPFSFPADTSIPYSGFKWAKVSDHGSHVMSSSPVPLKTRHSLVYADKPQTLDHLEDNIRRVIADIRPQLLEKVIENCTSRLDYIRASSGSPVPETIFKM